METYVNKLPIKSVLGCCKGKLFIQNDTVSKLHDLNEELCQKHCEKLYGGCKCYIHVFVLFFFCFQYALKPTHDLPRIAFCSLFFTQQNNIYDFAMILFLILDSSILEI